MTKHYFYPVIVGPADANGCQSLTFPDYPEICTSVSPGENAMSVADDALAEAVASLGIRAPSTMVIAAATQEEA